MRHRIKTDTLSRFSSYRKATIRSIATSVLLKEKIITTKAKAKVARRSIDKIITLGKNNTLASRRKAFSLLCDHKLVKVLFDEIAPKFTTRNGGYTRIIPYRNRRGDNAKLVILELTEVYKSQGPKKEARQAKKETKPVESKKQEKEEAIKKEKKVVPSEPIKEEKSVKQEEVKETPEPKIEKKKAPAIEKEKPKKPEEKPKDKQPPKKFFGGLRKLFKKERDSHNK